MISDPARRTSKWRREGSQGFLITTPNLRGPSFRKLEKGKTDMKAFVMMAAVLTSALLTVPTVTEVADAKVADLRLNA